MVTIKIKPHEDLCGSSLHINRGPFPSVQTLRVTSLLNPQGQGSSSTQRTSLMLSYFISPFYDCIEQSRVVNIFLMFSAGLHIKGSGLMNFSNDVCPTLKAVGQAKLSIHMCICVITSATGFPASLILYVFKKVVIHAFDFYSVSPMISTQVAWRMHTR